MISEFQEKVSQLNAHFVTVFSPNIIHFRLPKRLPTNLSTSVCHWWLNLCKWMWTGIYSLLTSFH